jgi:hypothetical protein
MGIIPGVCGLVDGHRVVVEYGGVLGEGKLGPSAADLGRRLVRKTLTIREIIDAQLCHCSSPKEVSKQKSSIRLERIAALDKLFSTGCASLGQARANPL